MQSKTIFKNTHFYIEVEESSIPWLKLFTNEPYRELGDMPPKLREQMWKIYDVVEEQMRAYYKPTKINMASFANMLPRVHIHIMARFENDSHYPNPMWGEQLREGTLDLPDEDIFYKKLQTVLEEKFKI